MTHLKNILLVAMLATGTAMLGACASSAEEDAQAEATAKSDYELRTRVRKLIYQDATFAGDRLDVNVRWGVVTITGTVENRHHVNELERMIEDLEDVRRVDIQVEIDRRF
ncbi:MAG: BON domain-containing protein [Gammaproteobacteria bacterium]|nr:BON domain-containing protein [Gammaproteobacteria bacterium]